MLPPEGHHGCRHEDDPAPTEEHPLDSRHDTPEDVETQARLGRRRPGANESTTAAVAVLVAVCGWPKLFRLPPPLWCLWSPFVLAVFVATAALWVFRDQITGFEPLTSALPFMANLSDASIAIAAAVALFLIPTSFRRAEGTLDWRTAQAGNPWGVLLLFSGGLSLAKAVQDTEPSTYIGIKVGELGGLPTVLLIAAICLVVLLLTELTSNTATAATFLPVLGGVAVGLGLDPLLLLVPAAIAATCSFMLPVGTLPNAIIFGTGRVTMGRMIQAGLWLNLTGVVLITAAVMLLGAWAMGISF